jgi:hypothetical protein
MVTGMEGNIRIYRLPNGRGHKICMYYNNYMYIYQIVHGTKGHMAVYGPGCHPQNIIWTEAKVRSIYYFVGERPPFLINNVKKNNCTKEM